MSFLFWFFTLLILANYVLFPAYVLFAAKLRGRDVRKGAAEASVSVIICAYNEERVMADKIRNTLSLRYPTPLEIIIVADGSSDRTAEIASRHADVVTLHEPTRRGKAAAMNRGAAIAKGEILLFSDANTFYDREAVVRLVENFSDETVGGVSGRKEVLKEERRESSLGDSLFWSYESRLKEAESRLGSIPTADGEIFAVRAKLYRPLAPGTINDDTAVTFDIVRAGYRVVYEAAALSRESASLTLREDMAVKARMVYGGYQSLLRNRALLLPPKSFFAWQFFLHKTLRHAMPFLLLGLFLTTWGLQGGLYELAFWGQTTFYLVAIVGAGAWILGKQVKPLYLPLYYCLMNVAAVSGFIHFLRARPMNEIWVKAKR